MSRLKYKTRRSLLISVIAITSFIVGIVFFSFKLDSVSWLFGAFEPTVQEPVISEFNPKIAELMESYIIAIPTPLPSWSDQDTKLLQTSLGQTILTDLLTIPEHYTNLESLTKKQRVLKTLFQKLDQSGVVNNDVVRRNPYFRELWQIYNRLELNLYPWIRPRWKNAFEISTQSSGRGIVMCVANHHVPFAMTALKGIREIHKNELPIEIFRINGNDLSDENAMYLESTFSGLKVVDINAHINEQYIEHGGWSVKAYAILASSFSEVLFMDADTAFFQDPNVLFEDPGYEATGSLFFLDRTLFPGWTVGREWLQSILPTTSSFVHQTRWYHYKSAHEQESSALVINKKKSLLGLLSACKLNASPERDEVTYKRVHGDKETFWIGYEMVQTPYAFVRSYGAVVGGLGDSGDSSQVCGTLLHLDTHGRPLFLNGGVFRDKNKWPGRYLQPTHFAEGNNWEFETSCIKDTDKIQELQPEDRRVLEAFIDIDKKRRDLADGFIDDDVK